MDILYYSNYCKHSQNILQHLGKTNVKDKISFICIDKRMRDANNNQIYILHENGTKVLMPPNVHSVPALLLVKQNYRVIYGDDIMNYFAPFLESNKQIATKQNGEPMGFPMTISNSVGSNIVSEQFTFYDMSPEELSAKGKGGMRQMYNYMPASQETIFIQTPPDNYRPDKLSNNVTIDSLQQQRNEEFGKLVPQNQSIGLHP